MDAPQPILAQRATRAKGWPLHDTQANRLIEQRAAQGLPPHTLMQRAGAVVAALVQAQWPHARNVSILVGPGNNGGDGLEAAIHLHRAGYQTRCCVYLPEGVMLATHTWPADAAVSLAQARLAGINIIESSSTSLSGSAPDVIVDALLGRGLTRPVEGPLGKAIEWAGQCAAQGSRILSVDLPSGLPADTGALSPTARCVRADVTLCLLGLAPGLFTADGRDVAGEIWWHDLGVSPEARPCAWLVSRPMLYAQWPARTHRQHKGSFGDVLIVGGAPGMAGAALLAGRAALLSGAGRVYLANLASPVGLSSPTAGDPAWPEMMTSDLKGMRDGSQRWAHATVVAGCGGGAGIASLLPMLLSGATRLVLDADALNAIAADLSLQLALRQRRPQGKETVLTPHPLEAARLLGCPVATVQADRAGAARRLAQHLDSIVVLKGSGTIVSVPFLSANNEAMSARLADDLTEAQALDTWIVPVGNAALSTAGSGDVLAGLLGSLWGQLAARTSNGERSGDKLGTPGTPETASIDASRATARWACASAVYLHGETAEYCSTHATTLPASQLAIGLQGRTLRTQ